MQIICPACNAGYNILRSRIPQGKRAVATCKKCGGKIVIASQFDPSASAPLAPPAPDTGSGEFTFTTETDVFKGYAGFWKRFVAAIIDGFSLMVGGFIIGGFIGLVYGLSTGTSQGADFLGNVVGITLGWLYYAIMESSSTQATLGKMALGIKVTDLSGNTISFGKATGRHFAKIISTFTLFVGYLLAAFTSKKQGLHDMVASCLVVNSR